LGGVFSLIPAVMWPSVAYIVRENRLGAAYSMMTLCQQIGVALVPLAVGRFNTAFAAGPENPAGYAPGMWLYTALAGLGLLFSWLLWRAETGPGAPGLGYSSGSKPAWCAAADAARPGAAQTAPSGRRGGADGQARSWASRRRGGIEA